MFVSILPGLSLLLTHVRAVSIEKDIDDARSNPALLDNHIIIGWVDPPAFRGTASILWSCTLTLVACVYTCIHVNIPPQGTPLWKKILKKVTWASVALILPELVLQAAFSQFVNALRLKIRFNKLLKRHQSSSQPTAVARSLTLEDAFYIVMGGLNVRVDHLGYPATSLILTHEGVVVLARNGHFITFSKTEIEDRSKASPFTKALVCIQISYMVLECTVRFHNGYHLALLEVNTLIHVFCALCIYLFWLRKPLDATISLDIDTSQFENILALMVMATPMSSKTSELSRLSLYKPPESLVDERADEGLNQTTDTLNDQVQDVALPTNPPTLAIVNDEGFVSLSPGAYLSNGLQWNADNSEAIVLGPGDIRRWSLCAETLWKVGQEIPASDYPIELNFATTKAGSLHTAFNKVTRSLLPVMSPDRWRHEWNLAVPNRSGKSADSAYWAGIADMIIAGMTVAYLPSIYGGIHFSVRNSQFPSETERLLWIIACITSMTALIGITFFAMVSGLPSYYLEGSDVRREKLVGKFGRFAVEIATRISAVLIILCSLVCGLSLVLYVISRIYIVVEAFISLRTMPLSVFATTPWLGNLAHVG